MAPPARRRYDDDDPVKPVNVGRLRMSLDDVRWLIVLIVAGIAWGLKLEFTIASQISRIEALNESSHMGLNSRVAWIEQQIAVGVLPRAEERIGVLEREHDELHQRLRELENIVRSRDD